MKHYINKKNLSVLLFSVVSIAARAADANTNAVTRLPDVVVTAQKTPQSEQALPVGLTTVTRATIEDANITSVKEAAIYAPNTFINQFTARAVSNPFFRGIGGSPLNPGVTTFIDGVPQLNNYSSSQELLDVDQVEFVRGPQGALFGRNTAGGLINITSRRPSDVTTGWIDGQYGNYNFRDVRGGLSGPIVDGRSGFSMAAGFSARDGFTKNDATGHNVDNRSAGFGKGQLLFQPSDKLQIRLILSGEADNDGDYALGDLGYIRAHPHHVNRNFEGFNHRDLVSATMIAAYSGEAVDFTSITGGGWWRNEGLTDLDYGPFAPFTHQNTEQQNQFTQEFRIANAKDKPIGLGNNLDLNWQTGVSVFTQDYRQSVSNFFGITQLTSARLNDWGMGLYGQGKLTAWEKLDITAGLRFDYENKSAKLTGTGAPFQKLGDDFAVASPQMSVAYRYNSNQVSYVSVARGYKAGGFNQSSPPGGAEFGTERSWNYELGHKSLWLDGKVATRVAFYYIDWKNLQLNQPNPLAPGSFYIANAGAAHSEGLELEAKYRPSRHLEMFGSFGYDNARFNSSARSSGAAVGGNRLPYAPEITANVGAELSWQVCKEATVYFRGAVTVTGNFAYDPSNAQSQSAYSLVDFRAGVRTKHWFVEGWADNAFDTHYVPIAIPYPPFAASGYIGESGDPVTFGLRGGLSF